MVCCSSEQASLLFVKNGASGNWSHALRIASFVNESRVGHESRVQVIGSSLIGQMVCRIRPDDNRCVGSQMCTQAW